ncbi:MAG: hypothetical protein HC785_31780 [Calothrix sp. CSU_2_0]|nr:hypothetical protein [Calothrix sp. CSU_2_0]
MIRIKRDRNSHLQSIKQVRELSVAGNGTIRNTPSPIPNSQNKKNATSLRYRVYTSRI